MNADPLFLFICAICLILLASTMVIFILKNEYAPLVKEIERNVFINKKQAISATDKRGEQHE